MNKRWILLGALAAFLAPIVAHAQDVPWQVKSGQAAIALEPSILESARVQVVGMTSTATGNYEMAHAVGFELDGSSNLRIMTEERQFGYFMDGSIKVKGGFYLRRGKNVVPVYNFITTPEGPEQQSNILVRDGQRNGKAEPALIMTDSKAIFDPVTNVMMVGYGDVRLSRSAAYALGDPNLADMTIGMMTVWANMQSSIPLPKYVPPVNTGGVLDAPNQDVSLHVMSSLQSMGRNGVAYPNGATGFAFATTSCNPGTVDIPWFQAMDRRHPFIFQNMFRIRNGRLEQIGAAYVKHGFWSLNTVDSSCGVAGTNPGGTWLGVGRTDLYGASNNASQFWLGPRSEINPLTGYWNPVGSLFDVGLTNLPPDGQRSFSSTQASTLNGAQNRLEVRDQDLIVPTGQTWTFWYEGFYILSAKETTPGSGIFEAADENVDNNTGTKRVNVAWNGSNWAVSEFDGAIKKRPRLMIQEYPNHVGDGSVTNIVNDTSEGKVYVASYPINLGNGNYQYEFMVYNFNSDRQIREFKVPVIEGLNITNIGFRDIDQNAGNDWSAVNSGSAITWSTQTFAQNPNANSLKYGSLYNFWFTANVAPTLNLSIMNLFKAPPAGSTLLNLNAVVKAPPTGMFGAELGSLIGGTTFSGGFGNIGASDNSYWVITENVALDQEVGIEIEGTATVNNANRLEVLVESRSDMNYRMQTVKLWNWNTSAWDTIDGRLVGLTEALNTIPVNGAANVAKYVNNSTRKVKARIYVERGSSDTFTSPQLWIDAVSFKVAY